MRRPQGYATILAPDGPLVERDTCTCGHCGAVVLVKPGTSSTVYLVPTRQGTYQEEPGAFCRLCMRAVCLRCHDVGTCVPFERRLEQMEARR